MKVLHKGTSTYHVLVGYYFKKQHEDGDQVKEVTDKLEDVHTSRVVCAIL